MIADVMRRVRNALAFGSTTNLVAAPGGVAEVQVRVTPLEVQSLRLVEQRGVASSLPIGTPVLIHYQSGDRSKGVVAGSVSPSRRPALPGPEDVALYGYGFTVVLRADGLHITAPDVFMSGNLHVAGAVSAGGQVTGNAASGPVGLASHTHSDPQGGATGAPNPGS